VTFIFLSCAEEISIDGNTITLIIWSYQDQEQYREFSLLGHTGRRLKMGKALIAKISDPYLL
jgi:uncharacterized membrane protein